MLVPWGEIKPDRLVHGDMVNPFNWRIPMGIHQLFLNGLVLMPATDWCVWNTWNIEMC